jgi:hypothetical protein
MCDLMNIDRDTYYDNVKDSIYNKLNQNENQTTAIEEYYISLMSYFLKCFDNLFEKYL